MHRHVEWFSRVGAFTAVIPAVLKRESSGFHKQVKMEQWGQVLQLHICLFSAPQAPAHRGIVNPKMLRDLDHPIPIPMVGLQHHSVLISLAAE